VYCVLAVSLELAETDPVGVTVLKPCVPTGLRYSVYVQAIAWLANSDKTRPNANLRAMVMVGVTALLGLGEGWQLGTLMVYVLGENDGYNRWG
jgi:hypothetical protein